MEVGVCLEGKKVERFRPWRLILGRGMDQGKESYRVGTSPNQEVW